MKVSLVAILMLTKRDFSYRDPLVQTVGRAARNQNGRVIMYADRIAQARIQHLNRKKA